MTRNGEPPAFVLDVFADLQRRRALALGIDDLLALRAAIEAGFGWDSDADLVELCVALWASSPGDAELVRTLFARHLEVTWDVNTPLPTSTPRARVRGPDPVLPAPEAPPVSPGITSTSVEGAMEVPPLPVASTRRVVLSLEFPIARRDVAQAFRRLRQPIRSGPAVDLDVDATIERRVSDGVTTAPVLVPRARYLARLLLLIDRQGSMTPFHPYLDHVRDALLEDSALERVRVAYFHNTPGPRADPSVLAGLAPGLTPSVDPVVGAIGGGVGDLYDDPDLYRGVSYEEVAEEIGPEAGVVVISDNGAFTASTDVGRLVSAIAFAKRMRDEERRLVWLNPVPESTWGRSTAAELSRFTPAYTLDRPGMHRAVDVLRGRVPRLERGL